MALVPLESILGTGRVPHDVNSQPLKSIYWYVVLFFNSFIYSPNNSDSSNIQEAFFIKVPEIEICNFQYICASIQQLYALIWSKFDKYALIYHHIKFVVQ